MMRLLWIAALVLLGALPAAHAQSGLSDFFRSVGSALKPAQQPPARQSGGSAATIGIRGMDDGGTTATSGAASQEVMMLDQWAVSRQEAVQSAGKRGLLAREVLVSGASAQPAPAE